MVNLLIMASLLGRDQQCFDFHKIFAKAKASWWLNQPIKNMFVKFKFYHFHKDGYLPSSFLEGFSVKHLEKNNRLNPSIENKKGLKAFWNAAPHIGSWKKGPVHWECLGRIDLCGDGILSRRRYTPKPNIALENRLSQKETSIPTILFFWGWLLHGSTSPLSGRSPFCQLRMGEDVAKSLDIKHQIKQQRRLEQYHKPNHDAASQRVQRGG